MGRMSCPSPSTHTEGGSCLDWFYRIHWNGILEGRNHDCQQAVVNDYALDGMMMDNEERIQCTIEGGALEWKQHEFVFR